MLNLQQNIGTPAKCYKQFNNLLHIHTRTYIIYVFNTYILYKLIGAQKDGRRDPIILSFGQGGGGGYKLKFRVGLLFRKWEYILSYLSSFEMVSLDRYKNQIF